MYTSFKIITAQGTELKLVSDLNTDACKLWNRESIRAKYVTPPDRAANWYDMIGEHITNNKAINYRRFDGSVTWVGVKESMLLIRVNLLIEDYTSQVENAKKYLKPYFDLIDVWESRAYKPVPVE